MAEPLTRLALRYLRDRQGVAASLTMPQLLWHAPAEPNPEESWEHTDAGAIEARPSGTDPVVFRLEKRADARNAFAMAVTVGRIASNDLPIDEPSVSRFHAYFQRDPKSGLWFLTDAESSRGTFLDGVKLAPNVKTPLVKEDHRVRVGDVELRFMLPAAFLKFLAAPT